jgi:ribose 1,5-bisphosphokinase PhnN
VISAVQVYVFRYINVDYEIKCILIITKRNEERGREREEEERERLREYKEEKKESPLCLIFIFL